MEDQGSSSYRYRAMVRVTTQAKKTKTLATITENSPQGITRGLEHVPKNLQPWSIDLLAAGPLEVPEEAPLQLVQEPYARLIETNPKDFA